MNIRLTQFKNHHQTDYTLSEGIQVVIGENGSGKSTLCEAISILCNAHNIHDTSWWEKSTFATQGWSIRGHHHDDIWSSICEPTLTRPRWYIWEKSISRNAYLASVQYRTLWITSDHLRILTSEPSVRRNFLSTVLSIAHPDYEAHLKKYQRALVQRNKVLQMLLDGQGHPRDLVPWEHIITEHAIVIMRYHRGFFAWLDMQPGIELSIPGELHISLVERHVLSDLSPNTYLQHIETYLDRDRRAGRTTVGPHLDDIAFEIVMHGETYPVKTVLSRGEMKTVLLSFIQQVGNYIGLHTGKKVIFLLDDVLSELDEKHIQVLRALFHNFSTIITTQPNHMSSFLEKYPHITL